MQQGWIRVMLKGTGYIKLQRELHTSVSSIFDMSFISNFIALLRFVPLMKSTIHVKFPFLQN
jgi:hypothetical protein